ncbi:hypothetical protein MRX96_005645 [Rhipicephalus microplus]
MVDGSSSSSTVKQQNRHSTEALNSLAIQQGSVVQPRRSVWAALLWHVRSNTAACVTKPPSVSLGSAKAPPLGDEASSAASYDKRFHGAKFHEIKPCDSTACVEQARMLLYQIDFSRNPCDDFYAYVCDKWVQSHPLTPGAERLSVDTAMVEGYAELLASALRENVSRAFPQLRFLVDHCVDPEPLLFDNLIAMFLDATHLRPWMMRPQWTSSRRRPSAAEVSRKFGLAFRQLGVDALFRPFVVKDISHENKRFVGLEEPSTVLLKAPLEKEEYEVVRAGFAPPCWPSSRTKQRWILCDSKNGSIERCCNRSWMLPYLPMAVRSGCATCPR